GDVPFGRCRRPAKSLTRRVHVVDAAHHRAGDRADAGVRLAASSVEYRRPLYARVGPFGPTGIADLGSAAADHHPAWCAHLDRHAYTRRVSAADTDRCLAASSWRD